MSYSEEVRWWSHIPVQVTGMRSRGYRIQRTAKLRELILLDGYARAEEKTQRSE